MKVFATDTAEKLDGITNDGGDGRLDILEGVAMRWLHPYAPNTQVVKNTTVLDDGWTMIANKDTSDRAAPQATGALQWVTDLLGGIVWDPDQSVDTDNLIVGVRYMWPGAVFIRTLRVWIPDGADGSEARVWYIGDPDGTPDIRTLYSFIIDDSFEGQWIEIPIGSIPVPVGSTFEILLSISARIGDVSFTWEWDYKRSNGTPPSGEAWHQSGNNSDQLLFHQEDQGGVDRTADLDNIGPGSTILMVASGYQWDVLSASKTGSVYTFIVEPATRAGEATSNFTFTYYGTFPVPYVIDTNFYLGNTDVRGVFSSTGYPNAALNDHAYGVDVQIQNAVISADWDVVAYSG